MPDNAERRARRVRLTADDKRIITDYLLYKLSQLQRKLDFIKAKPIEEQKRSVRRELDATIEAARVISWLMPGGRGVNPPAPKG